MSKPDEQQRSNIRERCVAALRRVQRREDAQLLHEWDELKTIILDHIEEWDAAASRFNQSDDDDASMACVAIISWLIYYTLHVSEKDLRQDFASFLEDSQ